MRSMGRVRASILTLKRARSFRRKMTLPEAILWQRVRRGGVKELQFRRQCPVGLYILDFFQSKSTAPLTKAPIRLGTINDVVTGWLPETSE